MISWGKWRPSRPRLTKSALTWWTAVFALGFQRLLADGEQIHSCDEQPDMRSPSFHRD